MCGLVRHCRGLTFTLITMFYQNKLIKHLVALSYILSEAFDDGNILVEKIWMDSL